MADAPETTKTDYRSTVFLPRTDFPMKAGLPQKEPAILERWESEGLYQRIRESREGRETDQTSAVLGFRGQERTTGTEFCQGGNRCE